MITSIVLGDRRIGQVLKANIDRASYLKFQSAIEETISDILMEVARRIRKDIIDQLPNKGTSKLADKLIIKQKSPFEISLYTKTLDGVPVWDYLEDGTGIYNPEHAGKGEGGRIIPYNRPKNFYESSWEYGGEEPKQKRIMALHFIWKGKEMFLKSVKGIAPRHYFKKYDEEKLQQMFIDIAKEKGLII